MPKKFNGLTETDPGRRGLARDYRVMKAGSAATATELREFIQQLRGKRPQEVMGLVAQSGLAQAILTASLGTLALLAVLTAGPYVWGKWFPAEAKAVAEQGTPPPGAQPAAAAAPPAGQATGDAPATPAADPAATADPEAALQELGIGETKTSDPSTNPLEDKADDLLKDLN